MNSRIYTKRKDLETQNYKNSIYREDKAKLMGIGSNHKYSMNLPESKVSIREIDANNNNLFMRSSERDSRYHFLNTIEAPMDNNETTFSYFLAGNSDGVYPDSQVFAFPPFGLNSDYVYGDSYYSETEQEFEEDEDEYVDDEYLYDEYYGEIDDYYYGRRVAWGQPPYESWDQTSDGSYEDEWNDVEDYY